MILQPVVGGTNLTPVTEQLIGSRNSVNKIFKTSKKFLQTTTVTPLVIWQGRTLTLNQDYIVFESSGTGTGFDAIDLSLWQTVKNHVPKVNDSIFAQYFRDPAFP